MSERQREEVANVLLAELMCGYGVDAKPETIQDGGRYKPDVLINYRGLRIVIEGKYADVPNVENITEKQTQERVNLGVAHIAVAVVYPAETRTTPYHMLKKFLAVSSVRFCVVSEKGVGAWHEGGISSILGEIVRVREDIGKKDAVQLAAEELSGCLDGVARLITNVPVICEDLARVLGVGKGGAEKRNDKDKRLRTIAKVATLTLANAFIFQELLAASSVKGVESLNESLRHPDIVRRSIKNWDWICDKINYVPIFKLASDILAKIPAGSDADIAVNNLAKQSHKVCQNRAALRHDLMGRIYHYLLQEAKFLGTYYTSVPSATLLLKLALNPDKWPDMDFGTFETLNNFRIADLACGTGTLLMASCQALTDNFVISMSRKNKKLDAKKIGTLHNALMEKIIHGYDVLPSAIHLTASTLAMLSPEISFNKLHLFTMPLGIKRGRSLLGSLEFIDRDKTPAQLSLFEAEDIESETTVITGKGLKGVAAEIPPINLFVMNPPFVRSVGGNLLFGNLPDLVRSKMQENLKQRVIAKKLLANVTAGLGGVFVAVADLRIQDGGRMAFILPAALTTGIAWDETRKLIQQKYHLEYVIVSHAPERWSFSENTNLSELLFIARKLKQGEKNDNLNTLFVNLWRNPENNGDALAVARLSIGIKPAFIGSFDKPGGIASLVEIGRKYGEILSIPMKELENGWWGSSFAQTGLIRTAWFMRMGKLTLPGNKIVSDIPLTRLGAIADLGPDARDIHDGFNMVTYPTDYPAFWSHDAKKVQTFKQKSNAWLSPRNEPAQGRSRIRDIRLLWPKAGRILFSERLRLNSQRFCAIYTDKKVLSNTWWTVCLNTDESKKCKALTLWQNSTLGLMLMIMSRVPSEGAWVKFKKPSLLALQVLNVESLTEQQINDMATSFDTIAVKPLLPISQMSEDIVRKDIDKVLSEVLNLPDLTPLREMLGREPVITTKSLFQLDKDEEAKEVSPQMELDL